MAVDNSAVMSAVGRLQSQGMIIIPSRTSSGPPAPTASSMPYAPPATQKKVSATSVRRLRARSGEKDADGISGCDRVGTGSIFGDGSLIERSIAIGGETCQINQVFRMRVLTPQLRGIIRFNQLKLHWGWLCRCSAKLLDFHAKIPIDPADS